MKKCSYLVYKEPRCEEEPYAEEDHGEVGEHGGVDGGHVAGHGGDVGDGHPAQISENLECELKYQLWTLSIA